MRKSPLSLLALLGGAFFLFVSPFSSFAQHNGKISGNVIDAQDGQPLEGATIVVLDQNTGAFIQHGVSKKAGKFTLTRLPLRTPIEIIISFVGYRDSTLIIKLDSVSTVALDDWPLEKITEEMQAVVVAAERAPFVIKGDTIEFNASAFKSQPNDVVRQLLRKLPGVLIDPDGNILVNGKRVNKINVDGKEFFTGNIQIAIENLPALIIDKVQVYETRELGEQYRSIISQNDKDLTLNLTLKEEMKKGMFGNLGAGYGTADRYGGSAFVNTFKEEQQVSVFGSSANIGKGSHGRLGGSELIAAGPGGDGIVKNLTEGAASIGRELGKNARISANYNVTRNSTLHETSLERTNILPDSVFFYNNRARLNNKGQTHNFSANFLVNADTLQTISVIPELRLTTSSFGMSADGKSTTTNGDAINSQQSNNRNKDKEFSFSNRFHYIRFSADRTTIFTLNWNLGLGTQRSDQRNLSHNIFYQGLSPAADTLDQYGDIRRGNLSNNISVNLYRDLGSNFVTILNYNFTHYSDSYDKDMFGMDKSTSEYDLPDSMFSIHNRNKGGTHVATASIGYKKDRLSVGEIHCLNRLLPNNLYRRSGC